MVRVTISIRPPETHTQTHTQVDPTAYGLPMPDVGCKCSPEYPDTRATKFHSPTGVVDLGQTGYLRTRSLPAPSERSVHRTRGTSTDCSTGG